MFYAFKASGFWLEQRESNLLDGAAHFYDTYECADQKFLAVGSIEPQFYSVLLEKLEISDLKFQDQHNKKLWPELKAIMRERIKEKTRDEWADIFDGSDACVAPVLNLSEAPEHHHMKARNSFVEVDGGLEGLVHVSEISEERVENVSDYFVEGEEVQVKVLEVDRQGKIRLTSCRY